jgi:hypothetical protein
VNPMDDFFMRHRRFAGLDFRPLPIKLGDVDG